MSKRIRFTKEDEQYLLGLGHPESDIKQLKDAFREVKLSVCDTKTHEERKIKRAEAIEILGRETFLSGISRCAFHATAERENADGSLSVYFSLMHWW